MSPTLTDAVTSVLQPVIQMPKKRQKPDHNTPTKDAEKRTKENEPLICPVCDVVITENTDNGTDNDALFCEGTWIYRKCVGMSRVVYQKLGNSDDPYICPNCVIVT